MESAQNALHKIVISVQAQIFALAVTQITLF